MVISWENILSAIIGGSSVALINYLLRKKERKYFQEMENRRKSYTDLLINLKGFLVNIKTPKNKELKQKFLDKYYNEIWLYAPSAVIKAMNNFLKNISDNQPSIDQKSIALGRAVLAIRKSLGIKNSSPILNKLKPQDYKIYSAT